MRSVDGTTTAALVAAPDTGIRERDFVTFYARTLDGLSTVLYPFWNDLDTVTTSVLRGDTGVAEDRDFVGDGALLTVPRIPLVSDLTIQTVQIVLSQIHPTVQNMVRGHDIRGALVEIHRGLFDPKTNVIAGSIYCHMRGKVNKAPIATPKAGDEGSISIDVVSIVRELTRTNPAKKSDETQKRRGPGDRLRQYAGVANVNTWWGQDKAKT